MQTFLPYTNFTDSAAALDRLRLGKQRVETLQIMTALVMNTGWVNHPATKMWRGYENSLMDYQGAIVDEWLDRGYRDTCYDKTLAIFQEIDRDISPLDPPWLGNFEFHFAHQSNLVRKDPGYYRHQFPTVPDNLEYIWSIN